jgi:tetratricopeptide (TPR) repeat protein
MKAYFFLLIFFSITAAGIAQTKPKPKQKEGVPTQKEMAGMMKEMQQAIDGMNPEDKKIMDSMGMKMPDMKSIQKTVSGLNDAQIQKAYEEGNRVVPNKDAERIAAIPKGVTNARMVTYVSSIHKKIVPALEPDVITAGDNIAAYLETKGVKIAAAGNIAVGLWAAGNPKIAIYLMGKICSVAPITDNLNNYASMLSMMGAEHLAIPILDNLNVKFPKNSTLLNNLGQAWFGLGEIARAEKYLDSAIRIYAYHSQANYTKSVIEESRGNTKAAADALMQSIKKSYSPDKDSKLQELRKKLPGKDIDFPFPMPQDPLGLEKFNWPDYPMNVNEYEIRKKEWDAFIEKCEAAIDEMSSRAPQLEKNAEEANQNRTAALFEAQRKGKMSSPFPWYTVAGSRRLRYLIEDKDNGLLYKLEATRKAVTDVLTKDEEWQNTRTAAENLVNEQYKPLIGEGRSNPLSEYCDAVNKVRNEYLSQANTQLRMAQQAGIDNMRRMLNDQVYYAQYTSWPEDFEVTKIQAKMGWLNIIKSQVVRFMDRASVCEVNKEDAQVKTKLAEFDDIACNYKSKTNFPGFLTMETNCSHTTIRFETDAIKYTHVEVGSEYLRSTLVLSPKIGAGIKEGPVKANASVGSDITINMDKDGKREWDAVVKAGVELGIGGSAGPVKAEATIGTGIELEIDKSGVQEVSIVSKAKLEAGIEAPESDGKLPIDKKINKGVEQINKGISAMNTSVDIGVESRSSLISGCGSVSGTGILKGITMSQW